MIRPFLTFFAKWPSIWRVACLLYFFSGLKLRYPAYTVQCTVHTVQFTLYNQVSLHSIFSHKRGIFLSSEIRKVLKGTVVNLTCHAVNRGSLQFLFDDKKVQNIDFNYMVHHEIILTSNSAMFCIKCNYIIRPHPPILPSANIITVINLNSTLCSNGGIMFQICKIISNTN